MSLVSAAQRPVRPEATLSKVSSASLVVAVACAALAIGLGIRFQDWRIGGGLGLGGLLALGCAYRNRRPPEHQNSRQPQPRGEVVDKIPSNQAPAELDLTPIPDLVICSTRIRVIQGDIIQRDVDVIVNAANTALRGGSGIDAAIEAAAGRAPYEECARNYPNGCNEGGAVWTGAGNLAAAGVKGIVHAVGPRMRMDQLLWSANQCALSEAHDHGARSVAMPFISTGVFGYNNAMDRAAIVAIDAIVRWVKDHQPTTINEIRLMVIPKAIPHLRAAVAEHRQLW
jgi:O-acetyl-ADP-ribose deacetylase